jgi:hypothetical protein
MAGHGLSYKQAGARHPCAAVRRRCRQGTRPARDIMPTLSGGSKGILGHINGVPLGDGNWLGGMTRSFMFSYSD